MSDNSTGLAMVDLQNAIDSEFEVAKVASVCGRSTSLLFNRVDTLSGKQSELKNILESIDAQLRQADQLQLRHNRLFSEDVRSSPNAASPLVDKMARRTSSDSLNATNRGLSPSIRSRSISTERRISDGCKDSPIVIDDEEEVFAITVPRGSQKPETVCASQNAVSLGSQKALDKSSPHAAVTQQPLQPSAQEAILANVRRRPKIIEKTPAEILDDRNRGLVAMATLSPGPGNVSSANVSENMLTAIMPTPSTSSPASFPVPMLTSNGDHGSSTESASSSFNDRSRSPLGPDDFELSQSELLRRDGTPSDAVSASSSPVLSMGRMLRASSATPTIARRPHSPSDFKVGSRVLGKRSSDIWFPGEITKMMPDKHKQTKYTVKYDKSLKGALSLNHICPEEPATVEDLCVGSRVVGLYGRLDIWYAGIVAEMPCTDNRNRFLIFFDDGFAQYLSSKKLHKVHHKGINVWEDVTEHSRDFIQEYLEDYPSRPMLHVRVGQWIRTEWMGQWLKAKVLSVDGSLAKMLFQIDNRSEWIYRGSTRLDPLYRALVMGEKTTSAKARSRKLTRNASSKGNTPYIEYNITKHSFGVSPYSKTDPKGIQQLQLEEQRRITQLQQQPQQGSNHTKEIVRSAEITQPKNVGTATVVSMKSKSIGVPKEAVIFLPIREPVIESTYSCIQASTLRKRTGVSLVSTSIFKPIEQDPVDNPAPVSTSLKAPFSNTTTSSFTHQNQNLENVDQKKAKGSPWKAPWLNLDHRNKQRHVAENVVKPELAAHTNKPPDVAAILINKLDASVVDTTMQTVAGHTTSPSLNSESLRSISGPHTCNFTCSQGTGVIAIDPLRHNPLAVPLLVDWKREIVKRRGKTNKRDVYYRTPCHRRLRNMAEVLHYLSVTQNRSLAIDQFTFDWRVRIKDITQAHAFVKDISNGQENRPLPAVNEVDSTRPPDVQYVSHRQLAPEVKLSKDPGFMVSCDCVDNCSDPATCTCIQLTNQICKAMDGKDNDKTTYQYKRLKDCIQTGIYECNAKCSCSKNCLNRVVQNGIQMRMDVFKTENRGWGLRAVDDIPAGTFICTYTGYLLNEELANQDGSVNGDEYMAELDYIEVAEKAKEGYESGVSDLEEDDNVIHEMLQFDENLSGSENSISYGDRSLCRDEDLEEVGDDDDEEEEEEEEEEDDDEDEDEDDEDDDNDACSLSEDNCSLSSGDDSIFGQRRKTLRSSKRKKVFKNQQKKKRGTISEESLVVERESKANVLSRLADPLMCILALKRNGNDLKRSLRFLRKMMVESHQSMDTESIVLKEKHDRQVNGVSGWVTEKSPLLSNSDFDLDELSDDALAAIHGNVITSNSTIYGRHKENEQTGIGEAPDRLSTNQNKEITATSVGSLETAPANNKGIPAVEDIEVAKAHAPELLSADDLKRLAASQPKSIEPPVLSKAGETRRGTVLDETIEKLKKRVNPFDTLLPKDVTERAGSMETGVELREGRLVGGHEIDASPECISRVKLTGDELGGSKISENSSTSDKTFENEHEMAEDDKCSLQSEGSLLSRNSSSMSQSTSSRVSSPTEGVENGSEKISGKVMAKSPHKDDKSEVNSSLSVKHVKTRSFFGEEHCYVIDAKTFGNCGRFLNHSCSPNLFVQNVFVDTHDLRFPWVAFFAQHNIKAGAELSWDYMYEVGSVRDKVLHCLCGSSECRGRLL